MAPADPQLQFPYGSPFDVAKVREMIDAMGHAIWLGMRYHDSGPDWVELAIPWKRELTASAESGILASGPIISLMDNATGMAIWRKRGVLLPQVTVDLRVDYMRAARPGRTVIGRGECYKLTRSIAFIRGIAYDESPEDPVAHVAGSFILVGEPQP